MSNQKTWEVWGRGFLSMSATQIGGLCDNLHTNVRQVLAKSWDSGSRDIRKMASVCGAAIIECNQVNISACTDHFAI